MRRDIEFNADGLTLRGWLYLPEGATTPVPTVVMAHGFSCVKEMFLDKYADVFVAAEYRNAGLGRFLVEAILAYAPLQQIALQRNFDWHRTARERIVARVEAGDLKPNVDSNETLIALGDNEPHVSAGGNDIVVDQADEGTYVLFLTSRGLKHTFTGFLHVPPGGDPGKFFEFDDKPPTQLVRYGKDWYFVAN